MDLIGIGLPRSILQAWSYGLVAVGRPTTYTGFQRFYINGEIEVGKITPWASSLIIPFSIVYHKLGVE